MNFHLRVNRCPHQRWTTAASKVSLVAVASKAAQIVAVSGSGLVATSGGGLVIVARAGLCTCGAPLGTLALVAVATIASVPATVTAHSAGGV